MGKQNFTLIVINEVNINWKALREKILGQILAPLSILLCSALLHAQGVLLWIIAPLRTWAEQSRARYLSMEIIMLSLALLCSGSAIMGTFVVCWELLEIFKTKIIFSEGKLIYNKFKFEIILQLSGFEPFLVQFPLKCFLTVICLCKYLSTRKKLNCIFIYFW